jgi:hypothetical protein
LLPAFSPFSSSRLSAPAEDGPSQGPDAPPSCSTVPPPDFSPGETPVCSKFNESSFSTTFGLRPLRTIAIIKPPIGLPYPRKDKSGKDWILSNYTFFKNTCFLVDCLILNIFEGHLKLFQSPADLRKAFL